MEHRKQYDIKIISSRVAEHEFPKGKTGLIFCKDCNAVYYKKSWHRSLRAYKNLREDLAVTFSRCPACEMVKNKQFEGEIIIKNVPEKNSNDLIHLIEAFCHRAYERDPMDRLINLEKTKDGFIVKTTENQLAVKLAKKIKETFKKVDYKISYSSSPSDVTYIVLIFK